MFAEFWNILSDWTYLDTGMVVTAALAAMACALPGNFLLLRRQSMMGDALSHTVLLGLVGAYLVSNWVMSWGWISPESAPRFQYTLLFAAAILTGISTAFVTELICRLGRVDSSAALGVVFTSFFALGLLLIRTAADHVHIDPDCVLFGHAETVVLDTWRETRIPLAAISSGGSLLMTGTLVLCFFKELRVSAFDPQMAQASGIPSHVVHYTSMAVTATTLIAAFESVGSVLVIAMLIVPPATANLLTNRLESMVIISLFVAAASAVFGHVLAITLPPIIFSRLGYPSVTDANSAGMMATTAGGLFILAMLFSPQHGILQRITDRIQIRFRIAREDILGFLYRYNESPELPQTGCPNAQLQEATRLPRWLFHLSSASLQRTRHVRIQDGAYLLTERGQSEAKGLVRSHRLWESYMAHHFTMPPERLHATAAQVEHFLNPQLRDQLESELDSPAQDPHGRTIPSETPPPQKPTEA
ncbi:MAG: metal ABC transporter permease [Planctomycetaceae bacterium]